MSESRSAISRDGKTPYHQQVREVLVERVVTGTYPPGGRVPAVRTLARELDVNTLSVWQAVHDLTGRDILVTVRGKGTFVADRPDLSSLGLGSVPGQPALPTRVQFVIPGLKDGLAADIVSAGRDTADAHGVPVTIVDSSGDEGREADEISKALTDPGCGLIVLPRMSGESARRLMQAVLDAAPVVLLDRRFNDVPCWYTGGDHAQGTRLATQLLVDRGCRRLAFIGGPAHVSSVHERVAGFRDVLGENGIAVDPAFLRLRVACAGPIPGVLRELFEHPQPPDGILFVNDYAAMAGMQALKHMGLRVPEDVAVTGFDNAEFAEFADPPLTTVRQDAAAIGKAAVELLLEMFALPVAERLAGRSRRIPVELIRRESA